MLTVEGASFELAKGFKKVTGLDFSHAFVKVCLFYFSATGSRIDCRVTDRARGLQAANDMKAGGKVECKVLLRHGCHCTLHLDAGAMGCRC